MNSMICATSGVAMRPRTQFLRVLASAVEASRMSLDQRVLIVGGSAQDEHALRQSGFKHIVNSNLPTDMDRMAGGESALETQHLALDAEQIELPDNSFDLVFASEVLHHCSSPHRALCEMLRVSRRYVLFLEPNDSPAMRALVRMRFSFPYELPAVIDHDYRSGGLRDCQIPILFIADRHEVFKTVSSYIPERIFFPARISLLGFQRNRRRFGPEESDSHRQHHFGNRRGQFHLSAAVRSIVPEPDTAPPQSGQQVVLPYREEPGPEALDGT